MIQKKSILGLAFVALASFSISDVTAQKHTDGTPLSQLEILAGGVYPADDVHSDSAIQEARRKYLSGNFDAARESIKKAVVGKFKSQALIMQSAIDAARYDFQESINSIKLRSSDGKLDHALKSQITWLESAMKDVDSLKKKYGRELVKTSASPVSSRFVYHVSDANLMVYHQADNIYEMNTRTGKKSTLMTVPAASKVFGVTTSIFPKITAVAVNVDGRYLIKVSSPEQPAVAKELQDRLITKEKSNNVTPYISMDGQNFLFASDRSGGQGGFDIYLCTYTNGHWTDPINVGSAINSPGNDIFPFLHPDMKSLFFVSNGHMGLGGYDIFVINLADGGYSPVNLGITVNDVLDQVDQYYVDLSGTYLYRVISGRIVQSPLQEKTMPHSTRFIYGAVKLSDKKAKRVTVKVDSNEGEFASIDSFTDGRFSLMLPYGKDFTISPILIGYLVNSIAFDGGKGPNLQEQNFNLPLIYKGMRIQYVINFPFNSSEVLPSEQRKLMALIRILKDNPYIQFELSGHSDDLGSDTQNMSISKARVAVVIDNLVSAGINAKRLNVQAYGQKKSMIEGSTDYARHMNRRVEISVLSWEGHEYAYGGDYRSRLDEVREELNFRRGLNFRIPAYVFWGLSAASIGGGIFYTLEADKEKKKYNDTLSYYEGTNLTAWHNENRGEYQSKLDEIYKDYQRNYNYSIYCYTAGGVFLGVGVFFFVWDYINKNSIVELEKEEKALQKIGFDIQFDPATNRGQVAVVYRF